MMREMRRHYKYLTSDLTMMYAILPAMNQLQQEIRLLLWTMVARHRQFDRCNGCK